MYINLHHAPQGHIETLVTSLERPDDSETKTYHLTYEAGNGELGLAEGQAQDWPPNVFAILTTNASAALITSLVDRCSIGTSQDIKQALPLPRSTPREWHYLHTRPGDIICFANLPAACTITTAPYDNSRRVEPKDSSVVRNKIQVESSIFADEGESTNDELDDVSTTAQKDKISEDTTDNTAGIQLPMVRPAQQKETQVYSTAPDQPSETNGHDRRTPRSAKSTTHSVLQEVDNSATDSTTHQVLETPLKQKPSQRHYDTGTPMLLDLAGHDKSRNGTLEELVPTLPLATPVLPTQESGQTSSLSTASTERSTRKRTAELELTASTTTKRARKATELNSSPPNASSLLSSAVNIPASSEQPRTILMTSSKYKDDKKMLAWLRKQGVELINEIPDKSKVYTCVVSDGKLPHTGKLLRSLALGRTVVEDEWLTASRSADELLDQYAYLPKELTASSAIDRSQIFVGKTIFFTSTLHSSLSTAAWKDFEALGLEAGARAVDHGSSRKIRDEDADENVLFIGDGPDDNPARQIAEQLSCQVYTKDLLKQSVLQGTLCTDEEAIRIDFSSKPVHLAGRGKRK